MDVFLSKNPSMSLQEAYDNACYAVPEVRNLMLKENLERETKEKLAKEELEKAKNAKGISAKSAPAGSHTKKNWETVLDNLLAEQDGE